jgi:excisionase family DNA binding protein
MIKVVFTMPDLPGYLTTQEAADKLQFHVNHYRKMIREGDLQGVKVGTMWFVTE